MTENTDPQEDNVSGNQTNIDGDLVQGDKVGGDKIDGNKFIVTNLTTYKYLPLKNIAIVLVVIAVGTVLFSKLLPDTINLPFPTPAAFESATEGEALIVVLPFTSDDENDTPDIHRRIQASIENSIIDLNLTNDVRVVIDSHATLHRDDREAAQALGEQHGAAVIIWGTETGYDITVKFLNIKEVDAPAANEQVQVIAPDEYVKFVVKDLPEQLTFLSLFAVGQAVVAEGELVAAIPIMEAAIASISEEMIAERLAAPEAAADAYGRLGWLYYVPPTQEFQKAVVAYEQSLVFEPERLASLGNLGSVYLSLGDYETAANRYEQSLAIAQAIGDKENEGKQLGNLGLVYLSLGDYETAASYHEQALAIAQVIGDKESEGKQLGNLGLVYHLLGDYETAASYHEQALAIAQAIGDKEGEGNQLGNLGLVSRRLGDYETAASYHEQALVIAQAIGDKATESANLGNLGLVYFSLGDYETAASYHEQSLAIAQAIGDKEGEGNQLGNLGNVYISLGDYETTVAYYEQALAIAQAIGDKGSEGDWLGNLGVAYYYMGEYETAVTYTQRALTIYEEIGSPYTVQAQQLLEIIQAETDNG